MENTAFEKRLKRQVIGKPHRFLAFAPLGFEQTLADELEFIRQETIDDSKNVILEPVILERSDRKAIESTSEKVHEQDLNRPHIVADGKVEFTAKITEAWKYIAYSRIANRIMMHIADFHAENFRELEKKAAEIPWELYLDERRKTIDKSDLSSNSELGTSNSLSIHVTCKHSRLYHSDAIAERLYKVINGGSLPLAPAPMTPVTLEPVILERSDRKAIGAIGASATLSAGTPRNAPQNLYVNILDDRCTIWLDLSGEELYKRGHERFVNDAPLKETIAAAMLFEVSALVAAPGVYPELAEWAQDAITSTTSPSHIPHSTLHITLFDPMAGSGTFSLEAAYIANGLIPGKCRDFALKHQPAFKEATWRHILSSSEAPTMCHPERRNEVTQTKDPDKNPEPFARILTSDISERAVEIIRHNVDNGPLATFSTSAENKPRTSITLDPQLRDFFTYTAKEIADACPANAQPAILLNPPYGKRLDFNAPKLYTQIGRKLAELSRELHTLGKTLTVGILAPKDDTRNGAKYTCTANLLRECPSLDPSHNPHAKRIETSHGGLALNVFFSFF